MKDELEIGATKQLGERSLESPPVCLPVLVGHDSAGDLRATQMKTRFRSHLSILCQTLWMCRSWVEHLEIR